MTLQIGRIDYLNIWHVFHLLAKICPEGPDFHYASGHPSTLNRLLACGELDTSPSSSFEYLLHAESYELLPGASISAHEEVQSVLFLSPVPVAELPAWLSRNPGPICLTGASATSTALLKVLWSQKWGLPEPRWKNVEPGAGLSTGRPFLEIGNLALRHFVHPPKGYHSVDLATEWSSWTGLPFVFAVWIVRRNLPAATRELLGRLQGHIGTITADLGSHFEALSRMPELPDWLTSPDLFRYWRAMSYGLGPSEQASLALFGERCSRCRLLPGMPGLRWFNA
ncbi:MAG: menaquinone biosynthesis protein [Desulfomicrobium sp.]|nr:menaquinone biosynthesis protein [Desulfomicrobium sp.]